MKLVIVYDNGQRYIASEIEADSLFVSKDSILYSFTDIKQSTKLATGIYSPVQHIGIDPEAAGVSYVIIIHQPDDTLFSGIEGKRGNTFEVVPVRKDITLDVLQDGIDMLISDGVPEALLTISD